MALTLSHDDLARMTDALHVLASPLAYTTTGDWCREALRTVAAFAHADAGVMLLGPEAREMIGHNVDDGTEEFFASILGPAGRGAGPSGIPLLDTLVAYTRCEHPLTRAVGRADRALGGAGDRTRSEWVDDILGPAGAADLVAFSLPRPTGDVMCSFFGHHLPLEAVSERLPLLNGVLASGLDALDRAGAHRAALDALDAAAAFFDADGREAHRTPALGLLLAGAPDAARLADALAATARYARAHAFPRHGEAAGPHVRRLHTPHAAYTLRATRLAPGALLGTDAFLVTVERTGAALPDAAALRARYGLTHREADVVRLVARGLSNADAARELSVSAHTVRHQLEAAMAKLGLSGRGREALAARLTGLDAA